MIVRQSTDRDLDALLGTHADAFGPDEAPEIVELVGLLLEDETAKPLLSLVAEVEGAIVGHVLFTGASIATEGVGPVASLLAPLAVASHFQNQGVGDRLVREGLAQLSADGVELVFVLGHPGYYPRFGFRPAGALGLDAPYPILEKNADAWMVAELVPGLLGTVSGMVGCAAMLQDEKYWIE